MLWKGTVTMPYKAVGSRVYVKRRGKWVLMKTHPDARHAKAHAAALNINVHKKSRKKGRR
jgi:hypothetical protein